MSRDQDTLLRSILSLDTPDAVFRNHFSTYAAPTLHIELLLEPYHALPINALPPQYISNIIHHLRVGKSAP
ncbi:MAG: hypothetical protein NVSMB27_36430 [Ktedonobacteraceae bacterium]